MQVERSQDQPTVLQNILHVIAANPDPRHAVPSILQAAQTITGASGASFLLFDESRTLFNADTGSALPSEKLETLGTALTQGLHYHKPSAGLVVAPVFVNNRAFGIFALAVSQTYQPNDADKSLLSALIDGLTIISTSVEVREYQERAHQITNSLLKSITDPLLVVDDDQRLLQMNPAAENIFKTTIAEARGKLLADVVQSEELMEFAQSTNKSQSEWTLEDKTFVPRSQPIYDDDGGIEGWVLTLRDISHFKKLNRNQNEFTRIVSHDLRSPLTSIQGFANMLEMQMVGALNEKQAHFVDKILSGIAQMTALVDNIQDAGRYDPETGFYEISRSQCDVNEIVRKIVDNALMPAEKGELKLSMKVADDVPIINADANMLERAIINLVDNAIKYTPNGGTVEVKAKVENSQIIISVSDSGYGISPENQRHLFERHVRIPRQEHKKVKGSGLGLFIVKSVAKRHGGDAWVTSVENQGSTFYMSIPLEGANLVGAEAVR
jgi:PAS domain S-box-containing protein